MPHTGLIYLVPHFHYDPVWKEDQRTYTARAFDLIAAYLELARSDPSFQLLLSELDYLQPYWNAFPQQRAFLRRLIADGRLEVNGGYNQPNETSIHGEALLRNLVYGRTFQRGVLGIAPQAYLPLDVFGHCPQLPQILRQVGFGACIFSKDIIGAEPLCRAIALDGSEVIQKREPYWFYPQSWQDLLDRLGPQGDEGAVQPEIPGLGVDMRLVGGDMRPPLEWLAGRPEELRAHTPELRVGLPGEYLEMVAERLARGEAILPASSRDLAMYHAGVNVSRIELKIANRLAENALYAAECWCAIAWALGADYPHRPLDKAWRGLMFGHHHDAITGVSSDIPFLDLMATYRETLDLAHQVHVDALGALAGLADTAPARDEALFALVLFNPLPWARTDVCRARLRFDPPVHGFGLHEAGRRQVPCQLLSERREGDRVAEAEIAFIATDVPPVGYVVYHVAPAARAPRGGERREADRGVIANEHYSVTAVAPAGGGLISILDNRAKRQLLDLSRGHPGNEIAVLGEQADREEPPWHVFTTGEQAFSKDEPAAVWVERGPVMERIIVRGGAADCAGRDQEIAVYRGVDRIDFTTDLRAYRGQHQLFAATFPLALEGCAPVFEERFGAVARRRSAGYLDYRTYRQQAMSGCALLPAQNWVELGNCLRITARPARGRPEVSFSVGYAAIITGGSTESRLLGERLMRILARCGVTAGAFTDDAGLEADRPYSTFRFSLSVGRDNAHAHRLLEAAPPAVAAQADKAIQRSGYAFVVTVDPAGERDPEGAPAVPGWDRLLPALLVIARDAQAGAAAVAELEKDITDGVISLPSHSNAVADEQPRADDYGVALINCGNIGASVEADGTAVLTLMHTTAWPGLPWGEGKLAPFFVPEHKDHRFRYALYAHGGDWRRGETTRRACEFNQPLTVVACAPAEGQLPARHSFLSVEPGNVFLSALKPRGNPLAMGARRDPAAAESLIARIYEGHGEAARAQLSTPFTITDAWRVNALEERTAPIHVGGDGVALDLAPCKIETLELAVQRQALLTGARLGPQREPLQPCHTRYWEHNLGPAPMGNQPVSVTMRGAPPMGATTRFGLAVASALADREAAGMVRLSVPAGWTITPAQVPFRLAPGGEQDYEVAVIIPGDAQPAYIRAEVEFEGQLYQEVLPVGDLHPVEASARRVEDRIEVTLRNPNPDAVQGRVDVITPLETWGAAVGEFALAEVRPAAQGFALAPGGETALTFEVVPGADGDAPDLWAYARVASYGHVQYLRCIR
ncbi:MAG TPA: glycoside hydrolase family 38 C-terminal domain-containing protein [Armatimonadota bacterium]|nr:glycoside hydrolase family 38 C-terminal domain-containing protein [Armatimonadota bacterium]